MKQQLLVTKQSKMRMGGRRLTDQQPSPFQLRRIRRGAGTTMTAPQQIGHRRADRHSQHRTTGPQGSGDLAIRREGPPELMAVIHMAIGEEQ